MQQASHLTGDRGHSPNVIPMLRPLFKSECHVFTHRGNHILFDVVSGEFFQIDAVAFDLITYCKGNTLKGLMDQFQDRYSEKDILSAFKELHDTDILSDIPPEKPRPFLPPDRLEIVHLDLNITTDTLTSRAMQKEVAYMNEQAALKAVDLLMKESGRIRQCSLSFQGGEPLLNTQLVEKVIQVAQEKAHKLGKKIAFEIITDGRLLNEELVSRFQKQNVNVVIQYDDDEHPPLFKGSGPYSLSSRGTAQHIQRLNVPVQLKTNAEHNIFDLSNKIYHGIEQYPTTERIALELDPLTVDTELSQAQTALENLASYVTQHVLNGEPAWIGQFEDYIFQVANQKSSFYHCGIGIRSLTVMPDGALYVDPQNTVAIGDVWQGIDRNKHKAWIQSTLVENMDGCATCWARHLCGGACRIGMDPTEPENTTRCTLTQRTYELAMGTCLDIADRDAACLHQRYAEQY